MHNTLTYQRQVNFNYRKIYVMKTLRLDMAFLGPGESKVPSQ